MSDLPGWVARPLPGRSALEGRYARLEPLDPARHGDGLFAALMGEAAAAGHRYLFEQPMEREAFDAWLAAKAAKTDIVTHVVVDRATGRIGGRQDFMRMDPAHGVIEIGSIHWGPAIAGTQIATEALYLAADHVFSALGYRRFEWKCHNANAPSRRAARRFGFSFEGIFHQHMVAKGANRDTAWFAMLDRDWPALKAGYQAWLDQANFGADGRQKRRLGECLDVARGAEPPDYFRVNRLRRASDADYEPLVALQQSAYAWNRQVIGRTPIPLEWDYRAVLSDWECFVLDGQSGLDAALIGMARPEDYYIESLSVAPSRQRDGLGNTLLEAGEVRARQYGRRAVRLLTNMKLTRNIDWYLAKGYRIERIERHDDREIAHFLKILGEEY